MRRWFRSEINSNKIALCSRAPTSPALRQVVEGGWKVPSADSRTPHPKPVRFEMMRFVDQIQEAFRETVRAGSLVGVDDLPSRLRLWRTPAETRDRMWSQVLRDYLD